MSEIAAALAQRDDLALPASWDAPFQDATFAALLAGNEPGVARLHAAVAQQDACFRAHLDACAGPARHCVLVDTGLYGSTVRMLQEGLPERTWSGLQFARCNYKRLATPHFRRTLGLSVESDWYKPWDARTSVLRFWHLIEACLEPGPAERPHLRAARPGIAAAGQSPGRRLGGADRIDAAGPLHGRPGPHRPPRLRERRGDPGRRGAGVDGPEEGNHLAG
ncbi:hypothetical protein [Methylobacterium radiotolerans]|uniref:hypothetical protein n=1 Tax=Methylobacterium radiotolerans TaxID=31998 RepID=UPI00339B54F2